MIAEAMAARERETAIKNLVRDMISRTLVLVLIGELLGAGIACVLGRLGSELLYGISERDPRVFGSVSVFLFLVSLCSASGRRGRLRAGIQKVCFGQVSPR